MGMRQNTTHAVMAQRIEPADSADDFPTPPWATRALMEHVIGDSGSLIGKTCLEPACGRGYMARPLGEYFGAVFASDAYAYGYAPVRDFLADPYEVGAVDWVITNPPFRLSEQFVLQALDVARDGVAILARTVFIEGVGRYNSLFSRVPPTKFAPYSERVPMIKGRVCRKATTATSYAWLVWEKDKVGTGTSVVWIPPCRKRLERDSDYPASEKIENTKSISLPLSF
jgi:hypothetical protein